MTIQAQLADGRVLEFPDGTDPNVIQSTVKRIIGAGQPIHQQETPTLGELEERARQVEIPIGVDSMGRGIAESDVERQATDTNQGVSVKDRIRGAGEATRALTLGGVAGLAGGALGSIEGVGREVLSGEFGSGLAEETAEKRMQQFSQPFMPKTEAGQEMLGGIGETLEPLGSLPPIIPGGAQASMLAKPALSQAGALSKATIKTPEALKQAKIERVSPEKIGFGEEALEGVLITKPLKRAVSQGFDEGIVKMASVGSRETKNAVGEMLSTLKTRFANPKARAMFRTTDSIGSNVAKRYEALKDVVKVKGRAVDRAAKKIQGEAFDFEPSTDAFFRELNKLGVKITRDAEGKFKAGYSGVDSTQTTTTQKTIDKVLERINEISGRETSANDAHKMKKLARSGVEFNALPTVDSKLASGFEGALKKYAHDINQDLRKLSSDYAKANDEFAEVYEPFSTMTRVFKTQIGGSGGEFLEKSLGTKAARGIMSNIQTRAAILEVLDNTDSALAKNNIKFTDDLIEQAVIADELERIFGTEATTSLSGQVQRAEERASILLSLGRGDVVGAAGQGVAKGLSKVVDSRINRSKAIEALERVLTEQALPQ